MNKNLDSLFKYRIPVYLWAIMILFFSSMPVSVAPQKFVFFFIKIPHIDIIGHFLVYAVFGLLMTRGLRNHYEHFSWLQVVVFAFLICTIFGIINELYQLFIPTRHFEYGDIVANNIGTFSGCLLYRSFKRAKIWQR